jgi:small subunit ribosomal protein S16
MTINDNKSSIVHGQSNIQKGGRLLRIRLARTGAKKKGTFRVVVIDRERARDGRFVEILGHYNPRRTPPEIVLNRERVDYWIGQGAQPSETVRSFLKKPPAPAPAA